jgi:hypothetical protein
MKTFLLAVLLLFPLMAITKAQADTFREFQGRGPAEVQKKANQAGFQYPDGEVECKSNGYCYQRWGKSN